MNANNIEQLNKEIIDCSKCELKSIAENVEYVKGSGQENGIMFIAQNPSIIRAGKEVFVEGITLEHLAKKLESIESKIENLKK